MQSTRVFVRSLWTFKRRLVPPLQKPKESPYIVGPYLKPDYLEREYITAPIKEKEQDDFNYFIYDPVEIPDDDGRKIELILIDDIEGLGTAGQVVQVPTRLGASKLVAMKRAEYLTDFTREWYKSHVTVGTASTALSPRTIRGLKSKIFDLPVSKEVNVKVKHIMFALLRAGVYCKPEAIQENTIVQEIVEDNSYYYKCELIINNCEKVELKFKVSY